ncbi:MAG: hypothetical protein EAX81_00640 [Candidatus Thorarchaeota archaeon]|nr:hypothetical protein [Candidatus Thorarchaeota archaeon]
MTNGVPGRYAANYVLGIALVFLLLGGAMQVFTFIHELEAQAIQSEYECALDEYECDNIYYNPNDIIQYVRIRQNPSGYFVLNPDLIFEPSELNDQTLKTTRFGVTTLGTINYTSAINGNATVDYVMSTRLYCTNAGYNTTEGSCRGASNE